ncbi:hypothetical protein F7725_008729 [Dissostichus mawsoni]|uniref:Uncharacterized protein n=1 Tax=Dissostichus mawsoni TaxID=36200 RepID=A0A7J5Y800_DISMA|nr:hypothetical protein F7725_008729 [Dissostichus mawsoni]
MGDRGEFVPSSKPSSSSRLARIGDKRPLSVEAFEFVRERKSVQASSSSLLREAGLPVHFERKIHHELFPVPSFWSFRKRLCRDRLCRIEFCNNNNNNKGQPPGHGAQNPAGLHHNSRPPIIFILIILIILFLRDDVTNARFVSGLWTGQRPGARARPLLGLEIRIDFHDQGGVGAPSLGHDISSVHRYTLDLALRSPWIQYSSVCISVVHQDVALVVSVFSVENKQFLQRMIRQNHNPHLERQSVHQSDESSGLGLLVERQQGNVSDEESVEQTRDLQLIQGQHHSSLVLVLLQDSLSDNGGVVVQGPPVEILRAPRPLIQHLLC